MSSAIVLLLGTCLCGVHGVQGMTASISASAQARPVKQATKEEPKQAVMRSDGHPAKADHGDHAKADDDKVVPADASSTKKVNIDVYYETRCPGCIMFINRTLEPLYRTDGLKDVLNITLYTYGNAMMIPMKDISDGYKFWHPKQTGTGWDDVVICQHGSDECLGNMVQLCAKDIAENSQYMELVFCMSATTLKGYSVEKSSYECMQKAKIDHDKVKECVQSPKGNQLMTTAGKQTAMLKGRLGTPWVMINNVHAPNEALMNSTLLMQSVCSEVKNVPIPCSPWKAKVKPAADPEHSSGGDSGGDDFQVFEKNMFKVSPRHV